MSSILEQLRVDAGKLVARYDTGNGLFEVRELQHYRWLHFGTDAVQGAIDLRQPGQPLLPYITAMLLGLALPERVGRILSLGLGVGMLERFILSNLPESRLTSVESEPQVWEITKEHFSLAKCDVRIMNADAFLKESVDEYDALFCDLHDGHRSSQSILEPHFLDNCRLRLNAKGVLVVNLLPQDESEMKAVLLALKQVFPNIMCYQVPQFHNVIVYGSVSPFGESGDILKRIYDSDSMCRLGLDAVVENLVRTWSE